MPDLGRQVRAASGDGDVDRLHLAGYLLAREAAQRPELDSQDLRRLVQGGESVRDCRLMLRHGRGNVGPDLEQTAGEGHFRMSVLQEVRKELAGERGSELNRNLSPLAARHVLHAAGSIVMQTANCDGNAALVAHLHAPKLAQNETLALVGDREFPHAWCELRTPGRPTVVLDAWAEGAPMLAEDSMLKATRQLGTLNCENRQLVAAQREQVVSKLRLEPEATRLQGKLDDARRRGMALGKGRMFEPTNFTRPAFASEARGALQAMDSRASHARAAGLLHTVMGVERDEAEREARYVVKVAGDLLGVRRPDLPDYPPPSS